MSTPSPQALSDTVRAQLLDLLASGAFSAGERLPAENSLARRFSVSRPIIRQALAQLRAEGRIETRKGSGTVAVRASNAEPVAGLSYGPLGSIADVRAFLEFRYALEGEMAARAAELRKPDAIAALRAAMLRMEADLDSGFRPTEADVQFHLMVARAADNRFYAATVEALAEQMRFSIRLTGELSGQEPPERLGRIRREHSAILEAIAAGKPQAARDAMRLHLRGGITRLFG